MKIAIAVLILITIFIMRKQLMKFVNKVLGWMKPKKEKPTPPFEPLPVPEPTPEPAPIEEPIPEPTPEPPVRKFIPFTPYVFPVTPELTQGKESIIVDIYLPETDEDLTDVFQAQIEAIPNGTFENPTVVNIKSGKYRTEGNKLHTGRLGYQAISYFKDKHFIILQGDKDDYPTFYTTSPDTPYGGAVNGIYSRRRHFKFEACTNIVMRYINVLGSNVIEGQLLGTAPEYTPLFWLGGKDDGAGRGAPGYKSYWEQEHGVEIMNCENFVLEHCNITGMWGDGVYIGSYINEAKGIQLRDLDLKLIGRQHVAIANNCDGALLLRVKGTLGRRAYIDFEPHNTRGWVRNIHVKDCYGDTFQTIIAALGDGDVSDIHLENIEYIGHTHIACGDSSDKVIRKNWTVTNNRRKGTWGSPQASMKFKMTENILIQNNVEGVSLKQNRRSIELISCDNVMVRNNDFVGGDNIIYRDTENIFLENNVPEQELIEV